MAKSKRAVVALPQIPPGTAPPGFDPAGPGEQRDIVSSKDGWSEYKLDDGTVLRFKTVVVDVKRAVNQYSADGNPLYIYSLASVNQVIAPERLHKKKAK